MKPEEQLLSGLLDHIQIDETRKQEQIHLLMQEAAHMEPQPKKSLLAQILVQSGYLSRWMQRFWRWGCFCSAAKNTAASRFRPCSSWFPLAA